MKEHNDVKSTSSDAVYDLTEPVTLRSKVSRRTFLKMGLMAGIPLLMPPWIGNAVPATSDVVPTQTPPAPLGRIATWWRQAVRKEAAPNAEVVAWMTRDQVLPLYAAVEGVAPWSTNPIWYQTEGGFIHSGYVQPVADQPQGEFVAEVSAPGFWVQVSQPWAEARWSPDGGVAYKLYYGTVYRAIAATVDEQGRGWYQLKEGISPWSAQGPYVLASSVRRIAPEELTPINPGVPDKWIKIDRAAQVLQCMEGETLVFSTPVSTGVPGLDTPGGEFRVTYKRHARRMIGGGNSDPYDLPGVPFPVYFNWNGVAIHGTYWHNDYGRRHSHGCINATPEASQWIFRWVEPIAPYEVYTQDATSTAPGTRVVVV